jgi:alkyl hydroperoxide reductase subunit AhpF
MADFKVKKIDSNVDFSRLEWWDVVIIGAGPAGLAAGLTTAHRALTTLVIEAKGTPGGQPQFLYSDKRIVDVPGFPDGITGQDLSDRTYRQAVDAHVQFRFNEELISIEDTTILLKTTTSSESSPLNRRICAVKSFLPAACCIIRGGCRHSTHWTPITFIIGRPESVTTAERP